MKVETGTKVTKKYYVWIPNTTLDCDSVESGIALGNRLIKNGSVREFKVYTEVVATTIAELESVSNG